MSMHPDSEDFEQLRRLLALKRHEQPFPGYFHNFSGQVVARIRAGERAEDSAILRLFGEANWLQRFWAALEAKPVLAGAVGVAACSLLLAGTVFSTEPNDTMVPPVATSVVELGSGAAQYEAAGPTRRTDTITEFQRPGENPYRDSLLSVQLISYSVPAPN